jgi:hypothetical protein
MRLNQESSENAYSLLNELQMQKFEAVVFGLAAVEKQRMVQKLCPVNWR